MESAAVFAERLEAMTYRNLQQIAKALGLPSNFKKIYLIELIVAKKYKTEAEVHSIIQRVRQERLYQSKVKKRSRGKAKKTKCQSSAQQILATRNSVPYSPPIAITPKRPSTYRRDIPEQLAITPVNPKRNLFHSINPHNRNSNTAGNAVSVSDRVLRSYTLKSEKQDFALINAIQELKTQRRSNTNTKFKIVEKTARYVRKQSDSDILKQAILISHGGEIIETTGLRKVQRIYLAQSEETIPRILSNQSVSIRRKDGSYTKINALVQKCNAIAPRNNKYNTKSPEITLQDKLDVNVPEDLINNCLNILEYPNVTGIDPTKSTGTKAIDDNYKENYLSPGIQQVYNEEKIRGEPLKDQRNIPLPKICDVFPRFNYMREPIYMQVGSDAIYHAPCYPTHVDPNITNNLETLYNLQTNAPLQQNNVDNTLCVYSVQTIPTATALPDPAEPAGDDLNVTSSSTLDDNMNNNQYSDVDIQLQEFLQMLSDPIMAGSSGSAFSLPDMFENAFEDALEIISQDTDYMKSVGMGEPVQCVYCGWARPIILLEGHIRKDHASSIIKVDNSEWNITYTLQSLLHCDVWIHKVIEYKCALYLLSIKYEHPGSFMATFSLLTVDLLDPHKKNVTLTLFNKRTGKPFSWASQVPTFSPNSLSDNTAKGLKINLSQLDLLTDGCHILYDVHVILFVKISTKNVPHK